LSVYLDASVLVGLFVEKDALAARARTIAVGDDEVLIVTDFAAAEFASVIARLRRMNSLNDDEAREIFGTFDTWHARFANSEDVEPADIRAATLIIRRLNLNIRAPDAINLAIARRLGASIATFDRGMAENARALGITVAAT
jgi:predicted nucleic acid-binding protein